MSPQRHVEMLRLLSELCDGDISQEQRTRLEALLEADVECRRFYLAYMDMVAGLLVEPYPVAADTSTAAELAPIPTAFSARRPWLRPALRYALVATATLAATLLVQLFLWPPAVEHRSAVPRRPDKTMPAPVYVATLTQAPGCVWDHPNDPGPIGPRLKAGELRLQKGIARIRFDSGSDLVVEGPADLHVDAGAATVHSGKVVSHTEESAAPFDLHTPCSTLVNFASECAVSVNDDGEEVHVFGGEVQRTPRSGGSAPPEVLSAGEARRYGPRPDSASQPRTIDPTGFARELALPATPLPEQVAGLLAYEGFDYPTADALRSGKANGGLGWTSRWMNGLTRPLLPGDTNLGSLNVKQGLVRHGAAVPAVGGAFDYTGFARYHRRLATPVCLDRDGVYFLSFLFRREGPPADPLNALAILLRTTEELQKGKEDARKRLNIGVGGPNQLFTHLEKIGSRTPVPLRHGETYLLVAKITASTAGPAQVFMRVYGSDDLVERDESGGWTVAGPPLPGTLVFEWLEIHINSKTRQTIDEFRLGTTWPSVIAPWLDNPKARPEDKS
jgi:ferric-dicitrate binding protein FerR (iron transport regulator)